MEPKEVSSAVTIVAIWLLVLLFAIGVAVGCSAVYQQNFIELKNSNLHQELSNKQHINPQPIRKILEITDGKD